MSGCADRCQANGISASKFPGKGSYDGATTANAAWPGTQDVSG